LQLAWGGSAAKIGALMRILSVRLPHVMSKVSSYACNILFRLSFPYADYFGQTMSFECTSEAVSIATKAELAH
jgi:hypothetical protein